MLLGVPIGYAAAQGSGGGDASAGDESAASALRESLEPLAPSSDESAEVDYAIEGPQPDFRVEECQKPNSEYDELTCEMIIAVNKGELSPGEYSRQELEEALSK